MPEFDTEFRWYVQPVRRTASGNKVVYKAYFWSPIPHPEMIEWCKNNLQESAIVKCGGGILCNASGVVVYGWKLTVEIKNKDDMFLFKMVWS